VTVNACRDRHRLAWWRRWRSGSAELREEDLAASGATPEEALLTQEVRGHLWAAFRRLSPRQQEVFALRHVEGFSTAEVAETLKLSAGSAKCHLFRAVHRLRQALQESP
jgi:RNA polymerase sigma-70 factor (ECF subfamily)